MFLYPNINFQEKYILYFAMEAAWLIKKTLYLVARVKSDHPDSRMKKERHAIMPAAAFEKFTYSSLCHSFLSCFFYSIK